MSLVKNLFGRKDLATKRDHRSRIASTRRNRRAAVLDSLEGLEDRRLLSVVSNSMQITAITSTPETDGGTPLHVTVPAGSSVKADFTFEASSVNTTGTFNIQGVVSSGDQALNSASHGSITVTVPQ